MILWAYLSILSEEFMLKVFESAIPYQIMKIQFILKQRIMNLVFYTLSFEYRFSIIVVLYKSAICPTFVNYFVRYYSVTKY
jgi:hypothetical protein